MAPTQSDPWTEACRSAARERCRKGWPVEAWREICREAGRLHGKGTAPAQAWAAAIATYAPEGCVR